MAEPEDTLDQAVSQYVAAISERDSEDRGPVLAWAAVAIVDDDGDPEAGFVIAVPQGQRAFMTRGILADALDAIRINPTQD